jgi:hypothetical protein
MNKWYLSSNPRFFFLQFFAPWWEKNGGGNDTNGFFLEKTSPNCHIMRRKNSQVAIFG